MHSTTGHRFECDTCDWEFLSQCAADEHMDDEGHWQPQFECDTCDRKFFTQRSADQHMDNKGHREPQFECETCNRRFHSQLSTDQHMQASNHYKRSYCPECTRTFENENALKMHLNSGTHRGKNVVCPFCAAAFVSATGLSHHLETGSCPRARNLNHRTIFEAISQRDPSHLLTNKLLTHPDFDTQTTATSASWNGSSYECYLCHRKYDTLQALDQHLNSPAHGEKLYHCPNRSCSRQFVRLAALFNHLESESCNFVRFEKVQEQVHGLITGRQRLIGFV